MKIVIVIITYNLQPDIFLLQVKSIRKFCKDDFDIKVFDNSYNPELAQAILYHCNTLDIEYRKTHASSRDGSDSHAFAANLSFSLLKNKYDVFVYLDHDLIPVKPFSVMEILQDKVLAGLGQGQTVRYMWPGCVMFKADEIGKGLIDFTPNHQLTLDTGAGFYRVIEAFGEGRCVFFNEEYVENSEYTGEYKFYSMINNGMFMHFVNSSNWNPIENNKGRLNSLYNIAEKLVNDEV
jgi:hypothetical protein